MAKKTVSQPNPKPEPKEAKYEYILRNIGDAAEGLNKALASKDDDGVRDNNELQVFSGMALGIACAVAGLFNRVVDQKIGGGK